MKQKATLRPGLLRRLKEQAIRTVYKRNGRIERVRPIKKIARARKAALQKYYVVRGIFLAREENRDCRCCVVRREHGENIRLQPATEVHHARGRNGALLADERFFVPTCYPCGREWIHQHPQLAREYGLLSSAADWNSVPR